jgi:hypothetical protein
VGRWGENHLHACWKNFVGVGAGAPGGIFDGFELQVNSTRWDPPYLETANDLPLWSGGRTTAYPPLSVGPTPYTRGDLRKMEYYLQMNTPGVPNGIWRVWDDGVLIRDVADVMYCEQYAGAQACESAATTPRPVIGGASRDAAYEIIECYWERLNSTMTFGGIAARNVPTNTQSADLLAMAVSGAP